MISDPTKAEVNLLKALKELDVAFDQNAGCLQVGLQTHLKNWHCSNPTTLGKYLLKENIIKYNPSGTHKSPLIYYDLDRRPSLTFCREILDGFKSGASINLSKTQKSKLKMNIPDITAETAKPLDRFDIALQTAKKKRDFLMSEVEVMNKAIRFLEDLNI